MLLYTVSDSTKTGSSHDANAGGTKVVITTTSVTAIDDKVVTMATLSFAVLHNWYVQKYNLIWALLFA